VADPDFEHASATPGDDDDVDVFAPLPGSRAEGQSIAALLRVEPVLGADATSTRVLAARSPRILHIATHEYFLPDETEHRFARSGPLFYAPTLVSDESVDSNWVVLGRVGEERFATSGVRRRGRLGGLAARPALSRSGIALAGANTWLRRGQHAPKAAAGLLTAEDVAGMDLNGTELVVLSACETGLGSLSRSDGILGLRWACAIAGARSLVMSLWKVSDEETLPFMETLYERILDGEPRASALRAAALALRSTHPDPYFWGAFILEGDAGPLQQVSTGATSVPNRLVRMGYWS
jgi:CHAT domain-containing protein